MARKENPMDATETKSQWGIVELMGHKVVAGQISKSEMLGKPMLRVDVPASKAYGEFTQFYGEGAIYCVTFTSEDVARRTAEQCEVNPVSVYVPDLVTVEQLAKYKLEYNELRKRLEQRALGLGEDDEGDDDPSVHRTCFVCGGEFWDGGTSCTCSADAKDK
jgi:hypothetical protein